VDEVSELMTFIICDPIFFTAPLLEVNKTICIMTEGILMSIKKRPMATAMERSELFVCPGRTRYEAASWIVTTWTKIINTDTRYDFIATSAISENLGIAQRRKINGERTALIEMIMSRLMYIRRSTIATTRKSARKMRVIIGMLFSKRFGRVMAFTSHAWLRPPVAFRTAVTSVLHVRMT